MASPMTIEQLQAVHHANPFKPFTILLADGQALHVPHRDFLVRHPRGRIRVVFGDDDTMSIVDLLSVTRLEVGNGRAARRHPKR